MLLRELNRVQHLTLQAVQMRLASSAHPLRLDVREPEEFTGEFGHIVGSVLIPLKEVSARVGELEMYKDIIVICRAGVRSTTAAAILTGFGFEHVANLKGGMVEWDDQKLPVERYDLGVNLGRKGSKAKREQGAKKLTSSPFRPFPFDPRSDSFPRYGAISK